jgi:hypothetical protein
MFLHLVCQSNYNSMSLFLFRCFLEFFVCFQFHTHVYCKHVVPYKCKYVLFPLNMLKLFQEINKGENVTWL